MLTLPFAIDPARYRRMGPRAAVLSRRANLIDCWSAGATLRRLMSPGFEASLPAVYPISGPQSAAEIALSASRSALASAGTAPESVGSIIYCHTVPDARLSDSTAGRLQHELGLKRANPFAVSQAHNVALLVGLDLALGLIEGPEQNSHVLLAASDTLLFASPRSAQRDTRLMFAGVGAATVVTAQATSGWQVEQVGIHQCDATADAVAQVSVWSNLLQQTLDRAGTRPAQITATVVIGAEAAVQEQVLMRLGLNTAPSWHPPRARLGRSSAADLLLALAELEDRTEAGHTVLAWCCGLNGEFACVLLTKK